MSKIFFFTGNNSIQTNQLAENAFGPISDIGATERYNLQNRFSVSADAPAYAITKALVLAMPNSTNSSLLNIALLPLNTHSSGFPIKMFIYRGIKKSSLVDGTGKIFVADSSWHNDNILKVIKDVQDKLNEKNATPNVVANSDSLGLQFSELSDDTFIEQLFFDDTDDFHPLIVDAGCQIGKFSGGTSNPVGIEVILDTIGYEPQLKLLKATEHILEVPELVLGGGLTEVEKLKLKFNNRFKKEEILSYVDITAFYGATKNQGLRVKGTDNGDDFLGKFCNKNTVYIDVRDDWGFSYNHFYKFSDALRVGFYSADSNIPDPVYADMDYYNGWPILKITNQVYNNNKKWFFLKIPISIGSPENINFLSSYVGKISTEKDNTKKKHFIIADGDGSNIIQLESSEGIKLKNWKYDDDKLGANYFLLKKSTKGNDNEQQNISSIWNNFFSLKMNNVFGFDNLVDGDFRVYTYSSINNPLIIDSQKGEAYFPTSGIAIDKNNVTFFAYKDELVYKSSSGREPKPVALTGKGKFNLQFDTANYDYASAADPHVGFLHQIVNSSKIQNNQLSKFSIPDAQDASSVIKFLTYAKSGENNVNDAIFETFETITLTHEEYNVLKALQNVETGDFPKHPLYIKCKEHTYEEYEKFTLENYALTLGIPLVVENEEDVTLNYVGIADSVNEITYNSLPISFTSIN